MKSPDIVYAIELYYKKMEINNSDIMQLFNCKINTAINFKKIVQEEMAKNNIKLWLPHHVNTKIAFQSWGIDISDLESRYKSMVRLKLIPS